MINTNVKLEDLQKFSDGCMVSHIGIEYTEVGKDYLCAKMPVDQRTKQPLGLLHGGANVALAETLGSAAASLCLNPKEEYAVGLEINANHIKSSKSGFVHGRAQAVHLGKKTQVWEIKIHNDDNELTCISRITMAIIQKK